MFCSGTLLVRKNWTTALGKKKCNVYVDKAPNLGLPTWSNREKELVYHTNKQQGHKPDSN